MNENEVLSSVATNIIEDSLKYAWDRVKHFFKEIDAKDSIRYREAYEEYLRNTQNKYSKIKTLIYRHVPRNLYSFYECIGVSYNGNIMDTSKITNLIDKETKIIITGTGGIGKSTLLKHFFLNIISETSYIPVLIELRSFNSLDEKNISLEENIFGILLQNGFELDKKYFEYSLKEGGYIILLDGLDEVNRDKVSKVTSEIRKFSDKYKLNKYIVSSRPSESFIGWNDFAEMFSLPLTKEQALNLIKKIDFDENIKNVFYNELDKNLFEKYKSFASNPLLLNIMLLTFDNNAHIPDKLNDFYGLAFSTLFNMHDATKEAYVRDIRTGLSCEDFKLVFSYICFKSYFSDEYEFTEFKLRNYIHEAKDKFHNLHFMVDDFLDDLTMSVCMIMKDGLTYRFAHRSFQEYFAALYTCKLTDTVQQKLLTVWLKESNTANYDSYFTMLYNMQGEKVNKIIFVPGIKELKKKVEELGNNMEFLKFLFEGIYIRKYTRTNENKERERKYGMSLRVKDRYFFSIISLACELNNYYVENSYYNEKKEDEIIPMLVKLKKTGLISFDDALKKVSEKDLYEALGWVQDRIEFLFDLLKKYEDNTIVRKRKVASILDEL